MTEPTEEQKQAAEAFCVGNLMGYVWQVARLLAEREAKLREEYQSPTQDVVISQLRARVAELEAREKVRDLAAEVDTGEPVDVLHRSHDLRRWVRV